MTGYGDGGQGDWNDEWIVKVIRGGGSDGRIKTVKTMFKLVHKNMGCTLAMTGKKLPKWGFEQVNVLRFAHQWGYFT